MIMPNDEKSMAIVNNGVWMMVTPINAVWMIIMTNEWKGHSHQKAILLPVQISDAQNK